MLRQRLSMLIQDDNPRLHRIPFLLFWISSYGLIWLTIYIVVHPPSGLGKIACWLRGEDNFAFSERWRPDLFVGIVIGLTLFILQRWLLQRRYGYVPKYLGTATLIGGIISGFGYPHLAQGIMRPWITIDDMILWFGVISVFQAVTMLQINRRGWLIALIGIGATSVIVTNLTLNMPYSRAAFSLATAIQAIGTGLAMLYLMGNPHQGVVPKRKSSEKPKYNDEQLSPFTFVMLWMVVFYIAFAGVIFFDEMLDTFHHVPRFNGLSWNRNLILPPILGIILGISQHWMIGKYLGRAIQYWSMFTIFGWTIVGILPIVTSDHDVLRFGWLTIPILAQTIAIWRVMPVGWLWLIVGMITVIFELVFFGAERFYFEYPYTWFLTGSIISFATALAFLLMESRSKGR